MLLSPKTAGEMPSKSLLAAAISWMPTLRSSAFSTQPALTLEKSLLEINVMSLLLIFNSTCGALTTKPADRHFLNTTMIVNPL